MTQCHRNASKYVAFVRSGASYASGVCKGCRGFPFTESFVIANISITFSPIKYKLFRKIIHKYTTLKKKQYFDRSVKKFVKVFLFIFDK